MVGEVGHRLEARQRRGGVVQRADRQLHVDGLHRVGLFVFEFNERAIRAYQRVGFVLEGRARQSIRRDGRWWDELQMSMLEADWKRIRAERRAAGELLDDALETSERSIRIQDTAQSRLQRAMERLRSRPTQSRRTPREPRSAS